MTAKPQSSFPFTGRPLHTAEAVLDATMPAWHREPAAAP